jgi:hypothetical protein
VEWHKLKALSSSPSTAKKKKKKKKKKNETKKQNPNFKNSWKMNFYLIKNRKAVQQQILIRFESYCKLMQPLQ